MKTIVEVKVEQTIVNGEIGPKKYRLSIYKDYGGTITFGSNFYFLSFATRDEVESFVKSLTSELEKALTI